MKSNKNHMFNFIFFSIKKCCKFRKNDKLKASKQISYKLERKFLLPNISFLTYCAHQKDA